MTDTCPRWLTTLALLGLACGCSELGNCPTAQDTIVIDRPDTTDKESLIFESSKGWKDFDAFPAKTVVKFKHGLGVTPAWVNSYLAFSASATNGEGGGSFAETAGNEVLWDCIDAHTIVIRNDTCESSFYVKIVAGGVPSGDADDDSCGD